MMTIRGFMLDEARHFFGKETVKAYLDRMAQLGYNSFHWHLTDDQGWRIDLPGMPELVRFGATRPHSPLPGGADDSSDGIPYGPFFYSVADLKEVVSHAAALGIRVVPEIDLPGHVRALLAAHPEFSCVGESLPREPWCCYGVCSEVLCAGNDEALAFCKGILDAVMEIFPSEFIHVGGDECPKARWKACPKCQARLKREGLADERALQGWLMRQLIRHIESKGRRAVGWDEIFECDDALPRGTVIQRWRRKADANLAAEAARKGHDIILSPLAQTYLSIPEGLPGDPYRYRPWVLKAGLRLTAADVRRFDPLEGIPPDLAGKVIGGECCAWTEVIHDRAELDYKVLNRLAAFAEAMGAGKRR